MKVTKSELYRITPNNDKCGGIRRFEKCTGGCEEFVCLEDLVGKADNIDEALWLASRAFDYERILKFACDCALLTKDMCACYWDCCEAVDTYLHTQIGDADSIYATSKETTRKVYAECDCKIEETKAAIRAVRAAIFCGTTMGKNRHVYQTYSGKAAYAAIECLDSPEEVYELLRELFREKEYLPEEAFN